MKKVRVVSHAQDRDWSFSFLSNIIILPQTVLELLPAQDFGLREDNYLTKKVTVVSLACDMPTSPPLHSYQILPKYVKGYQSYGMHKDDYNFCFRGDNYITNKVRVVSLARDMPTGPPLYPYQILSNYLKQY